MIFISEMEWNRKIKLNKMETQKKHISIYMLYLDFCPLKKLELYIS